MEEGRRVGERRKTVMAAVGPSRHKRQSDRTSAFRPFSMGPTPTHYPSKMVDSLHPRVLAFIIYVILIRSKTHN